MRAQPPLTIWTIYLKPRDYPDKLVAREWLVREGVPIATENTVLVPSDRYDLMEEIMMQMRLTKMEPMPGDDPVILECWL